MALILSVTMLKAQTWVGGGADWNDPANWNPGLPSNGATITIDGLSATVDVISTFTPGQIDIINGGELIINSTLDVSGDSYTNITGIGSRLIINSGGLFTAEFIASTDNGSIKITGGELDVADQLSMTEGTFDITGGLLDYNGSTNEEFLLTDSDFNMSAGTIEFDRGIIVSGGTFTLTEGATMITTSSARNLEFHDANADIDGTINNPTGDLSLFGTSNIDILENASITLDDLVLNDDGTGSTLNIFGTIIVTDDLKFDEDPPDDFANDNDQINVKIGGTLTVEIAGTFRNISSMDPTNNINVEGNGTDGGTLNIANLESGFTPEDIYGTLVTSQDGAKVTMEGVSKLPVVLIKFSGQVTNQGIQLEWITAVEINNDYFEILKSNDGISFNPIAKIEGFGNSNQLQEYSYIDRNNFSGNYYYQLKQVDFNGDYEYHQIILVSISGTEGTSFSVYPNPITDGYFTIRITDELTHPVLEIYSMTGKLLVRKALISSDHWILNTSDLNLYHEEFIVTITDEVTGQKFISTKILLKD